MYFLDWAESELANTTNEHSRTLALIAVLYAVRRGAPGIDDWVIDVFNQGILRNEEMHKIAEAFVRREARMEARTEAINSMVKK